MRRKKRIITSCLGMRVKVRDRSTLWALCNGEVSENHMESETFGNYEDHVVGSGLLVRTSKKGWPYTEFEPSKKQGVFVCREVMRVWHIVRRELARWTNDNTSVPRPYVLVISV
ncbi:hypothetical protein TRVL_10302 [Trypanosoma vivax]|nr:hypothetical protein TRVL_10302 [Trypanosoma vivax]